MTYARDRAYDPSQTEGPWMSAEWLIATDEAGYGPILGPLVIVATVAKVRPECTRPDWMPQGAQMRPSAAEPLTIHGLQIGDSKRVFKRDQGWREFERSVLSLCHAASQEYPSTTICRPISSVDIAAPESFRQFWEWLAPRTARDHARFPWYRNHTVVIPATGTHRDIQMLSRSVSNWLHTHGMGLVGMYGTVLETLRYNLILDRLQNKATLLAHATLQTVKDIVDSLPAGNVFVICDKFGGRNRYGAMIQSFFPYGFVNVYDEGEGLSHYRTSTARHRVSLSFRSKGEEHPAIAISSMVAKYMRELAMISWNAYWNSELPDLRPTAGYYEDGLRFLREIESIAKERRMPDKWLRRVK